MGPQHWWQAWRHLLRRDCRAIATYTLVPLGPNEQMVSIVLCCRWRWHRGPCRAVVSGDDPTYREWTP